MDLTKKLDEFKEYFLPEDFTWRKGQREAVTQILNTYLEGKHSVVILDAPVGSGKSIIGIASAWIMNTIGRTGYILASDISLQDQYEADLRRMNLNWGSVKGVNNYVCNDNGEVLSMGTCKIRNKNPRSMSCYDTCQYYSARDRAGDTQTSLLNYAYWLIMMNYVYPNANDPIFEPRDFLIADEGHKIVDIIQNQYAPRFDKNMDYKLDKMTSFFDNHSIKNHDLNLSAIRVAISQMKGEEDNGKLLKILMKVEMNMKSYLGSLNVLKKMVDAEYKKSDPPKTWKTVLRMGNWLKDFHMKVRDYVDIIDSTSVDYLIKNPSSNNDEIVFNCLYESYLIHKYFHKWSKFTVLMSATFSDPREYLKLIAIKGAKYIKMETTFDYAKSPIHFYNQRRMSYNHIDRNLPWLTDTINHLIGKHAGERGIIHTASYHLAMKIWEELSRENKDRVLVYNGTAEKRQVLEELKNGEDKVLMGPSLLEGLDLKDNWSRFQIVAKVPYPSLGDRFVKAKMDRNPAWYRWKAILALLQGIGRSVRSETDWAKTYILDGSFVDLLHRSPGAFPPEFRKRIKLIKE